MSSAFSRELNERAKIRDRRSQDYRDVRADLPASGAVIAKQSGDRVLVSTGGGSVLATNIGGNLRLGEVVALIPAEGGTFWVRGAVGLVP